MNNKQCQTLLNAISTLETINKKLKEKIKQQTINNKTKQQEIKQQINKNNTLILDYKFRLTSIIPKK